jgi:hypothetical protein
MMRRESLLDTYTALQVDMTTAMSQQSRLKW